MSRLCGDWLREYMDYTRHSEAPDVFHFWTGVSVIAGALRRRVWIDQRYFQWVPNFYIFFVAPAGIASKSTTTKIGMDILKEVDGVKFGPDVITWQKLAESLAAAKELVPLDPTQGIMGDSMPMSCLTISAGELGTFLNPQDREMVDVLVSLWDAQPGVFMKSTKTQGEDIIENPWLNIIGCTTPAWLEGNFPEYMIGGGFTSRSIFVYAENKRQYVPYPADVITDADFGAQRERLVHDLQEIATMIGEFTLSKEAHEWGVEWYKQHWSARPSHMASERYGGYIARKQTHIHKLAMILSASKSNELVINKSDLEVASQFISGLEADMKKVFSAVGAVDESRHITELRAIVRAYKNIKKSSLWRLMMNQIRNPREFDELIKGARNAGYIKEVQNSGEVYIVSLEVKGEQQTE